MNDFMKMWREITIYEKRYFVAIVCLTAAGTLGIISAIRLNSKMGWFSGLFLVGLCVLTWKVIKSYTERRLLDRDMEDVINK